MERVTTPLAMPHLSDLTDDELAQAYAPLGEPWLRVNFVSTVDGAAQGEDGLNKSINNPVDKRVFNALRRQADCLVVGAGYAARRGVRRAGAAAGRGEPVGRGAREPARGPRGPDPDGDHGLGREARGFALAAG